MIPVFLCANGTGRGHGRILNNHYTCRCSAGAGEKEQLMSANKQCPGEEWGCAVSCLPALAHSIIISAILLALSLLPLDLFAALYHRFLFYASVLK